MLFTFSFALSYQNIFYLNVHRLFETKLTVDLRPVRISWRIYYPATTLPLPCHYPTTTLLLPFYYAATTPGWKGPAPALINSGGKITLAFAPMAFILKRKFYWFGRHNWYCDLSSDRKMLHSLEPGLRKAQMHLSFGLNPRYFQTWHVSCHQTGECFGKPWTCRETIQVYTALWHRGLTWARYSVQCTETSVPQSITHVGWSVVEMKWNQPSFLLRIHIGLVLPKLWLE